MTKARPRGLFGLQPPELEIALAQGTDTWRRLQFSKPITNETRLVYARCAGNPVSLRCQVNWCNRGEKRPERIA